MTTTGLEHYPALATTNNKMITNTILNVVAAFLGLAITLLSLLLPMVGNAWGARVGIGTLAVLATIFGPLRELYKTYQGSLVLKRRCLLNPSVDKELAIQLPAGSTRGWVLLFLARPAASWDYYYGEIRVDKHTDEGFNILASALLPRHQPMFRSRWRIPTWFGSSDAGKHVEIWPRGMGGRRKPVLLYLDCTCEVADQIRLVFNLQLAVAGTRLADRLPAKGEPLDIIVRTKSQVSKLASGPRSEGPRGGW